MEEWYAYGLSLEVPALDIPKQDVYAMMGINGSNILYLESGIYLVRNEVIAPSIEGLVNDARRQWGDSQVTPEIPPNVPQYMATRLRGDDKNLHPHAAALGHAISSDAPLISRRRNLSEQEAEKIKELRATSP